MNILQKIKSILVIIISKKPIKNGILISFIFFRFFDVLLIYYVKFKNKFKWEDTVLDFNYYVQFVYNYLNLLSAFLAVVYLTYLFMDKFKKKSV
jgi:hypothetical protein